jgi:putative oxidoreductase
MKYVVLLGRILYAFIFVTAAPNHFTRGAIAYAAGHGVPLASVAVPLSGILALAGGLSILMGYKAKYGAWLLVFFLVPVTIMMHNFWAITDPMGAMIQKTNFMKNLSMLGTALLIAYFGSGPLSVDGGDK